MDKRLPHWKTTTGISTVNGEQSNATEVTSEVPQGTVLAPLLFLCFINDQRISKTLCRLFYLVHYRQL